MDTSISEYIKELNNFNSYYQQCKYIHRNIYSIYLTRRYQKNIIF